ncbi:MAG: Uracil-DNA glycosylase superfamily [Chthoniobacter sp.]|jgi:uracil-DNA glycosylase|nr:Uracil-DNA glycosylase superfamily [Chthoniobacter sp.]
MRIAAETQRLLNRHVTTLRSCTICPKMHRPAVSGGAVVSRVMSVGQAPGNKEPLLGRPFAWTAGKTLFGWFQRTCGVSEDEFRASVYMAAVCRCFPGKSLNGGGDRVPDAQEIVNCSRWLEAEIALLRPDLVIPIGKLAITQFIAFDKLTDIIGKQMPVVYRGHRFDVIPLPHPSGASPWHRMEPGKTLLDQALRRIARHPAWRASVRRSAHALAPAVVE